MLLVIKLGGSLATTPALKNWLHSLTELKNTKVVIVPGGGPFADKVRETQYHWRFDDAVAHQMALLGMEQYGWMMNGICPRIPLAKDLDSIKSLLKTHNVCIWLPYTITHGDKTIPQTWEMTSDSLSAWLANLLDADKLILVKSVRSDEKIMDITRIVDYQWVDSLFPSIVQRHYQSYLVYKDDFQKIDMLFRDETIGTRVLLDV